VKPARNKASQGKAILLLLLLLQVDCLFQQQQMLAAVLLPATSGGCGACCCGYSVRSCLQQCHPSFINRLQTDSSTLQQHSHVLSQIAGD